MGKIQKTEPIGNAIMCTRSGRRNVKIFGMCSPGVELRKLYPFAKFNSRVKNVSEILRYVVRDEAGRWYAPNQTIIKQDDPDTKCYRDIRGFIYSERVYNRILREREAHPDRILKMAYDYKWETRSIALALGISANSVADLLKHRLNNEPEAQCEKWLCPDDSIDSDILTFIREN